MRSAQTAQLLPAACRKPKAGNRHGTTGSQLVDDLAKPPAFQSFIQRVPVLPVYSSANPVTDLDANIRDIRRTVQDMNRLN